MTEDIYLEVYELDNRKPALAITYSGEIMFIDGLFDKVPDNGMRQTERIPKILFADVPVMIHTAYGFMLAPMMMANEQTGPPRG